MPLDEPLEGSANAVDLALARNAFAAAAALVNAGAPVAPDALADVDEALSPELAAALLANGARPDVAAVVQCVACGAPASARLIAQACVDAGIEVPAAFQAQRAAMLADLETALAQVSGGARSHYLGPEGLMQRIEHLRSFEL